MTASWLSVKVYGTALHLILEKYPEFATSKFSRNRIVRELLLDGLKYRLALKDGLIAEPVNLFKRPQVVPA